MTHTTMLSHLAATGQRRKCLQGVGGWGTESRGDVLINKVFKLPFSCRGAAEIPLAPQEWGAVGARSPAAGGGTGQAAAQDKLNGAGAALPAWGPLSAHLAGPDLRDPEVRDAPSVVSGFLAMGRGLPRSIRAE